jgi:hypothetical protein
LQWYIPNMRLLRCMTLLHSKIESCMLITLVLEPCGPSQSMMPSNVAGQKPPTRLALSKPTSSCRQKYPLFITIFKTSSEVVLTHWCCLGSLGYLISLGPMGHIFSHIFPCQMLESLFAKGENLAPSLVRWFQGISTGSYTCCGSLLLSMASWQFSWRWLSAKQTSAPLVSSAGTV